MFNSWRNSSITRARSALMWHRFGDLQTQLSHLLQPQVVGPTSC
jgi:hypothetical protein